MTLSTWVYCYDIESWLLQMGSVQRRLSVQSEYCLKLVDPKKNLNVSESIQGRKLLGSSPPSVIAEWNT